MNWNYVFFWGKEDYYRFAFADIINLENVIYIDGLPRTNNKIIKKIHKIHNSRKINKYIQLPLRKIWFKNYFENCFQNNNPIIFIFHASYYWMRSFDYFDYLKSEYPNSKCVFIFMDSIKSYKKYFSNKFCNGFDIKYLKDRSDLILSYNKADVKEYNLIYYPSIYSTSRFNIDNRLQSDIFFVGRAKDRLRELHDIYLILCSKGFKCDFYIMNVEKNNQMKAVDIHYNTPLTYEDVIKHVICSKGILEVVQKNTEGFTFRLNEALVYEKNIITNNPIVKEIPYCDSKKIFSCSDIGQLTLQEFKEAYQLSYGYKHDYSPLKLLKFLEENVC